MHEQTDVHHPVFAWMNDLTPGGPMRCSGAGTLHWGTDSDGEKTAVRAVPGLEPAGRALDAANSFPEHACLPRVRGALQEEESALVLYSLPQGSSLAESPLAPWGVDRALDAGIQLTEAFGVLHQSGNVHGTLGLHSLVKDGGRLLVQDAVLSVVDRCSERRPGVEGLALLPTTVDWLSPQRARGHAPVAADDVYALAAILCRLAGAPIAVGTPLERLYQIAIGRFRIAPTPNWPAPVRRVLSAMLSLEPSARPTAAAACAALEQARIDTELSRTHQFHAANEAVPVRPAAPPASLSQAELARVARATTRLIVRPTAKEAAAPIELTPAEVASLKTPAQRALVYVLGAALGAALATTFLLFVQ